MPPFWAPGPPWTLLPLLTMLLLQSDAKDDLLYGRHLESDNASAYALPDTPPSESPPLVIPSPTSAQPKECEEAKIRCALRRGCAAALQAYMFGCDDLIHGRGASCDPECSNALVGLTSTDEGKDLMNCQCRDDLCQKTRDRMEVCREEVLLANAHSSVVTCSVAYWICSVDTQCGVALSYYERYCRRMFSGKSCSFRCNNSISILQRQEKAAKLETCLCTGNEDFNCTAIKANMARLCFPEEEEEEKEEDETVNEIDTENKVGSGVEGGALTPAGAAMLAFVVATVVRWSLRRTN